jgi:predicted RNA-binding Zn ribbon-like protein
VQIESRPIAAIRLHGGRLCLDFVNTIHDRGASVPEDYIATPERFLEWSLRAGAVRSGQVGRRGSPARAWRTLRTDIIRLRDHLYALFSAQIDRTPLPASAVRGLDRWVHRSWRSLRLDPAAPDWLRQRRARSVHDAALQAIALSALELLRAGDLSRLRRCKAPGGWCGWLFYDETRNGSRRWCSMENCGALFKTRRYRLRKAGRRSARGSAPQLRPSRR